MSGDLEAMSGDIDPMCGSLLGFCSFFLAFQPVRARKIKQGETKETEKKPSVSLLLNYAGQALRASQRTP